jgi:hypothetical protein
MGVRRYKSSRRVSEDFWNKTGREFFIYVYVVEKTCVNVHLWNFIKKVYIEYADKR